MSTLTTQAPPFNRGQLNGVLFVALFAAAVTQLSALPSIARLGLSPLIIGIFAGMVYGNVLRDGMPQSWAAGRRASISPHAGCCGSLSHSSVCA